MSYKINAEKLKGLLDQNGVFADLVYNAVNTLLIDGKINKQTEMFLLDVAVIEQIPAENPVLLKS